jgi:uncharacterized protein with PQ loop repeat
MFPADGRPASAPQPEPPASGLDKALRSLSVVTLLMTLPQVYTVWFAPNASGVSVLSWASYLLSACLWFVYGLQKKDKTIYLACIGWIVLDAAIVVGAVVRG